MSPERIPKKLVKATIYTNRNLQIEGMVYTGSELRLSDEFGLAQKKLLFLKDATIRLLGTDLSYHHDTAFINKQEIVLISTPEDHGPS